MIKYDNLGDVEVSHALEILTWKNYRCYSYIVRTRLPLQTSPTADLTTSQSAT